MTQRDIVIVLATLAVAVGLSAILFVGAAVTSRTAAPEPVARPRVFFDSSNNLPPGLTVVDAQRRVGGPLQAIVPLQRGISDTARDAAGLFLTLLLTASTLVLANDQVVAVYRASLGDWRSQARVLAAGFVVIGLAISTAALTNIVTAASSTTTTASFFIDGLTVLAVALVGVACVFAAHALMASTPGSRRLVR